MARKPSTIEILAAILYAAWAKDYYNGSEHITPWESLSNGTRDSWNVVAQTATDRLTDPTPPAAAGRGRGRQTRPAPAETPAKAAEPPAGTPADAAIVAYAKTHRVNPDGIRQAYADVAAAGPVAEMAKETAA